MANRVGWWEGRSLLAVEKHTDNIFEAFMTRRAMNSDSNCTKPTDKRIDRQTG